MSYILFSMTERKAAKRHRCIWCGEHIEPGDTYSDERSVYDGEIQRMRWHPECRADAEDGWKNGADEEFMPHCAERPEPLPKAPA
ncbi:hypothetical protein [Piscinibacter gummiphilus]|uniref:PARP-type domain-containing protein n=1 Tax=Piscinibacter gummiphilus TaxID=946333 RepID=A0ABZ0CU81_9BURK|nr:hypothetical protein [Piscinibacter gummiphilus]WOB06510.1 hypothetical protein RXV79_16430 [Piscinibacter gummiphilus]